MKYLLIIAFLFFLGCTKEEPKKPEYQPEVFLIQAISKDGVYFDLETVNVK